MSFKGTEVRLGDVTISGTTITFTAYFVSKAGKVHGSCKHTLPISEESDEIKDATKTLVQHLEAWVLKTHFGKTLNHDDRRTGISESLGSRENQG